MSNKGDDDMDKNYYESYRKLGLNIQYYRKDKGYTQQELAELLDIDRTHMGNIELARAGVSLDVLFRLAEILDVSINHFFEFK